MKEEKISWPDVRAAIHTTKYVALDKEEIQLLIESKFDAETRAAIQLLQDKKVIACYRVGKLQLFSTYARFVNGFMTAVDCVMLPEIYLRTIVKFDYKNLKKLLPRLESQIAQNKLLQKGYRLLFAGSYLDMSIEDARAKGLSKGLDKHTIDSILSMILIHKAAVKR